MSRNPSGFVIAKRALQTAWALGFLLAIASLGYARTQSSGDVEPSLRINVRVYSYANVSRRTLVMGEKETSRIFDEAGVGLVWLDCPISHAEEEQYPACERPLGAMTVDLKILSPSMAARVRSNGEELGFALPSTRGGSASAAWVYYQRVEDLAESQVASRDQILGHAIAHEIGHLLLGADSHSHGGIMCANWDRKDLREAACGQLLFTFKQAELIRGEVRARAQQQAPVGVAAMVGPK